MFENAPLILQLLACPITILCIFGIVAPTKTGEMVKDGWSPSYTVIEPQILN